MQIFSILLIFVSFNLKASCEFKKDVTKVTSLSGIMAVSLKELGLLSNSKMKGITVFAPITKEEFKGARFPGGIFLSQQTLSQFDNEIVFYDEARELRRILTSRKSIKAREVATRNLTPLQAIESTLNVLNEFVINCDKEITQFKNKALNLEKEILKLLSTPLHVIFYIGQIKKNRLPETIMANDGIVKWLREKNKIETYPSDLAYVSWSAKIMQDLEKKTLHVGIKDSGQKNLKVFNKNNNKILFEYPGSLVPGLSQLEAFLYLFQKI